MMKESVVKNSSMGEGDGGGERGQVTMVEETETEAEVVKIVMMVWGWVGLAREPGVGERGCDGGVNRVGGRVQQAAVVDMCKKPPPALHLHMPNTYDDSNSNITNKCSLPQTSTHTNMHSHALWMTPPAQP
jgi:hypothetical protein